MSGIRHKRKSKKWWISEAESRLAYAYALMYYEWEAEYHALGGISQKDIDKDVGQSSTESAGIRREDLFRKMELIDQTLIETDPQLYKWLKIAILNRGVSYEVMLAKGMPCSDKVFYDRRRKFYYLLSKRI